MDRKRGITALSFILALLLGLSSCTTISPTPTTQPTTTPQYHTVLHTIEPSQDYSFPVYLHNDETLHLIWIVEGSEGKIWFHIITPSGKNIGFYENEGQFANHTLAEGFCRGMEGGVTQFKPSEYNWGEGYYTILLTHYFTQAVTVKVEYWIETQ
jgi:hypothetical protein